MSRKRRNSPEWQWEQALIDAYVDYRWHQLLDPLHAQLHRWEQGELTHDDLDQAIHKTHKETQRLYGLFTERRELLVRMIQWDEGWFASWLAEHAAPQAITLAPSIDTQAHTQSNQ